MPNLEQDKSASLDSNVAARDALAEQVFRDPKEFLHVLQQELPNIPRHYGSIHQPDDFLYVMNDQSSSQQQRAAATIAKDHWKELTSMGEMPGILPHFHFAHTGLGIVSDGIPAENQHFAEQHGALGITADDIQRSLDLAEGRTTKYQVGHVLGNLALSGASALGAIGMVGVTAAVVPTNPELAPAALAVPILAGYSGAFAYRAATQPGRIAALAEKDHRMLSSWDCFNRGGECDGK